MADADLTYKLKLEADISQVRAAISEIVALGKSAEGVQSLGGESGATSQLSAQIARLEQLQTQMKEGYKKGTIPPGDDESLDYETANKNVASKIRAEMRAVFREISEAVDEGLSEGINTGVKDNVRLKKDRQSYGAQPGQTEQVASGAATAEATAANREIAQEAKAEAARLRAGRQNPDFTAALAELDTETKLFYETMERLRAVFEGYAPAATEAAAAHRSLTAKIQAAESANQEYVESTIALAATNREMRDKTTLGLAGRTPEEIQSLSPTELKDQAAEASRRGRVTDKTAALQSASPEELGELGDLKAATAQANAAILELANQSRELAAQLSRAQVAQAQLNTATNMEKINTDGAIEALAAEKRSKEQLVNATNEYNRSLGASGALGGSRLQRVESWSSPTGASPVNQPSLLQGVVSKGIKSSEYMLGGMVSGAALFGLMDAVKEATKLQEVFAGLKDQLDAMGQGAEFGTLEAGIKNISDATGQASEQVATFAERLVGIYGDPIKALGDTKAAMGLVAVSGVDINALLENAVPIEKAYGISMEQIADSLIGIHDQYGIQEKDMLQFLGETSATAKEAGYSWQSLEAIGAFAANSLGQSAQMAGQQFAKVIDTIQNNSDQIFAVFREQPQTRPLVTPIVDALAANKGEDAMKLLLASYDSLNGKQQQDLLNVIGSRREWAFLAGTFGNSSQALDAINRAESGAGENTGKLRDRFAEVSGTIGETVARIQDLIKNLTEGLVSSGVGQAFGIIVGGLEQILQTGALVLNLFNAINDATKLHPSDTGLLVYLTMLGTGYLLVKGALSAYSTAKEMHTRTTALLTAAEDRLTGSTAAAAEAEEVETGAIALDSDAKRENIVLTENMAGETVIEGGAAGAAGSGVGIEAGALTAGAAPEAAAGGLVAGLSGMQLAGAVAIPVVAANWARGQMTEGHGILQDGAGLNELETTMKANLKAANTADLQRLADDHRNAWNVTLDNIESALFHVDMPVVAAQKELASQAGSHGRDALDMLDKGGSLKDFAGRVNQGNLDILQNWFASAGQEGVLQAGKYGLVENSFSSNPFDAPGGQGKVKITKDNLTKALPDILKAAQGNDATANYIVGFLGNVLDVQNGLDDLRAKVQATADQGNVQKAIDDAGGIDQYIGLFDPKGALDTGQITPVQYQQRLQDVIADQREKLNNVDAKNREAGEKKLNELLNEGIQLSDKLFQGNIDLLKKRAEYSSVTPKTDELALELANFNRLSTEQARTAELPTLEAATQSAFEEHLSTIKDPAARYAAAQQGVKLPPAAISADLERQLSQSTEWAPVLAAAAQQLGTTVPELIKHLSDKAAATGRSPKDILAEDLKAVAEANKKLKPPDAWDQAHPGWHSVGGAPAGPAPPDVLGPLSGVPDITTPDTQPLNPQQTRMKFLRDTLQGTLADIGGDKAKTGAQGARSQAQNAVREANAKLNELLQEQSVGGPDAPGPAAIKDAQNNVALALRSAANVADDYTEAVAGWAAIEDWANPVKAAGDKLRQANLHTLRVFKDVGGDARDPELVKSRQQQEQAAIDVTKTAQAHDLLVQDWAQVLANGDPMGTAMANIGHARLALAQAISNAHGDMNSDNVVKAQQDLTKANQELSKAQDQEEQARFGLLIATSERNPGQVLILQQQEAAQALSRAIPGVDATNKLAAKIKADHALEDYMGKVFDARASLAEALATAAGDTILAAQIAAQDAQRKLDQALSQGITDETVIDPLKAAVASANANLQKTSISRQEQIIDFQQQMGYITVQTAIAQLKLLLDQTKQGTQDYETLALKIHQLEQQAGADLQFNLPTNLGLPTLYEARRLDQSVQAGIGYQDNRNIALVVNVNGAQDATAVSNQVVAAFQSAVGSGPVYPTTIGVGSG